MRWVLAGCSLPALQGYLDSGLHAVSCVLQLRQLMGSRWHVAMCPARSGTHGSCS